MAKISEEKIVQMVVLRQQGETIPGIAKRLHVSMYSVSTHLRRLGVDTRNTRHVELKASVLKMVQFHNEGLTTYEIAEKIGSTQKTVAKHLRAAGVTLPEGGCIESKFSEADILHMHQRYQQGLSLIDLIFEFDVSRQYLARLFHEHGLEVRQPKKLDKKTRNRMVRMYQAGKTGQEIADKIGVHVTTVYDHVRRQLGDDAIRTLSDYPDRRHIPEKLDLDVDEILRLYFQEKWHSLQVAKHLGTSAPTILSRIREAGYEPRRNHSGRHFTRRNKRTGRVVTFDSTWEFPIYQWLHKLSNSTVLFQGEHDEEFRAPSFVLNRTKPSKSGKWVKQWEPDFVIPEMGIIVEVKGHPDALRVWRDVIFPSINNTEDMQRWSTYLWDCDPEDIDSPSSLQEFLSSASLQEAA